MLRESLDKAAIFETNSFIFNAIGFNRSNQAGPASIRPLRHRSKEIVFIVRSLPKNLGGLQVMKWFALVLLVVAFPASLFLVGKGLTGVLPSQESKSKEVAGNEVTETLSASSGRSELDLREASTATLRKIDEIDKKIESARDDLRKNEFAKQAVIKDLIKIQAKINGIIKSESNL